MKMIEPIRTLPIPYQMLYNGTYWKSREARFGLALTLSRCMSFHTIRDGMKKQGER
jgi:hypothetical protein